MRELIGDDRPNVNHLTYAAFERVAQQFLTHKVRRRAARFSSTGYTIFTNCLDSHLSFEVWRRH